MSSKTIEEKIEFLNGLVDGSLCIIHYAKWELNSYKIGSSFCIDGGMVGPVCASGFGECVDKAFRLLEEVIVNA